MELHEIVDRVDSKETFLEFVAALLADLDAARAEGRATPSSPYGPYARDWENPELGRFLEAMHACAVDTGDRVPASPNGSRFTATEGLLMSILSCAA